MVGPVALGLMVRLHIMVGSDGAQPAHLMASEKKNSKGGTDTHMPLSGTATSNLRLPLGPTCKSSSTSLWYRGQGDPSQLEPQSYCVLWVWQIAIPFCLSFSICKMRIMAVPVIWGSAKSKWCPE